MNHEFQRELEVALDGVRRASIVCRGVQSGIDGEAISKDDRSPVTIADFASQAVVCRALKDAFPDDPIIGEEDAAELRGAEGDNYLKQVQKSLENSGHSTDADTIYESIDCGNAHEYADRFWTIDPIDGTKGFLRGDQYAVALALCLEGELEVGLLGCPNLPFDHSGNSRGTIFYAIRGQGTYQLPIDDPSAEPVPVKVSQENDAGRMRMCESVESGHSSHSDSARLAEAVGIGGEPRRLDSQAKYAVVSRGEAEIYLRLPTRPGYREKIWDHGGGVLCVTEAGGIVTDAFGRKLDFTQGSQLLENRGVVATNGPLHEKILAEMEALGIQDKYD
ncbi:MAG: 3'(2'),5'-bisphosphate nucleotidase [Planctomycetaceae bacterium]|nr:3'(2'),5'-bisphosphate nucleotidase [Planctomycetaceae bacterium]